MREERENITNRNRVIIYMHERITMTFAIVCAKILKRREMNIYMCVTCVYMCLSFSVENNCQNHKCRWLRASDWRGTWAPTLLFPICQQHPLTSSLRTTYSWDPCYYLNVAAFGGCSQHKINSICLKYIICHGVTYTMECVEMDEHWNWWASRQFLVFHCSR